MSTNTFVNYSVAFCIQFAAVLLALSLIKHLRFQKTAALVLAAGLSLMAIRRLIPFQHFFPQLDFLQGDHYADSVLSIVISLLLFSGLFGLRKSMSRLEDYTDLIENRSRTDYLTGAWNRLEIERRIEIEISRSRRYASPLALVLIDIDHFKQINDNYGHDAGDQVIRLVSDLLRRSVRSVDLVGRLGGDEFVILVQLPSDQATAMLERTLAQVRSTDMQISAEAPVMVTLSIGLAASDGPARYQLAQLMTAADAALYVAKDRGRAQVANLELEAQRSRAGGRGRKRIEGWQVRGA